MNGDLKNYVKCSPSDKFMEIDLPTGDRKDTSFVEIQNEDLERHNDGSAGAISSG